MVFPQGLYPALMLPLGAQYLNALSPTSPSILCMYHVMFVFIVYIYHMYSSMLILIRV